MLLEERKDFDLVPNVISGSHHLETHRLQLGRQQRSNAEPVGRVFHVGDRVIDMMPVHETVQVAVPANAGARTTSWVESSGLAVL